MYSLTSIDQLVNHLGFGTLVRLGDGLGRELGAGGITVGIHCLLECITLPAKHIIAMGPIASTEKETSEKSPIESRGMTYGSP